MFKIKRTLSLIVVTLMLISICGCTNNKDDDVKSSSNTDNASSKSDVPDYLNATGFPIVNAKIQMSALVDLNPVQPHFDEILALNEYEKMTNIDIVWDCVPSANIKEKRNLMLASGTDLPDLMYRSGVSEKDMIKYGNEGLFIKLNELIDKYAPNFKATMDKFEDVRKGVPTANGNIYAFPGLSNTPEVETNPKIYINTKWLEASKTQMPTTTDEFYNVLKAFKNTDCNGNTKKDEIPITGTLNNISRPLRGAWGLGNRGFGNEWFDIDPKTNEIRYIPAAPEYKELLKYLNKLYTEGLIDKEVFTTSTAKILAQNEQGLIGAFCHTNTASSANSNRKDFKGLTTALKGPNGDQLFAAVRGHIATKTGFLITKECKYPEAAVRWIDYFYGDEGVKLIYMGVEGVSYDKVGDQFEFKPEIVNNIPKGSSFDQVISKYTPYCGGGLPALSNSLVFKGGETQPDAREAYLAVDPFKPKELWAPFSFTIEEMERKSQLETDINGYKSQMEAEFIQGKTSLDKFDDYVKQLNAMGLKEYIAIYKAAYDRYKTR